MSDVRALVNGDGMVTKAHMLRVHVNGLSCLGDVPTLDGEPFTGVAYVVLPGGLVVGTVVIAKGHMASDVMGCMSSPPWAPCVDRDECVRTGDGRLTWQGRPFTGTVCTFDVDWHCIVEETYDEGSFVPSRRASWYADGSPHSVHCDGKETTWFSDGSQLRPSGRRQSSSGDMTGRVDVLWATVDCLVDPNVGHCDLWVEWGIPLTKGQMKRREWMCKLTVDCGKPQA